MKMSVVVTCVRRIKAYKRDLQKGKGWRCPKLAYVLVGFQQ